MWSNSFCYQIFVKIIFFGKHLRLQKCFECMSVHIDYEDILVARFGFEVHFAPKLID